MLHALASAGQSLDGVREAVKPRPPNIPETDVTQDLSPGQAAQQTGLSRSLIYREIERGHLRAYKVGGRLRITAKALADWKRQHAVVPRRQTATYEPAPGAREVRGSGSFASELRAIRAEGAT